MEDLPKEVDVVILGTGLVETIVAAAASRLDKSVVQLDENTYYGRDWAGFRLQDLRDVLQTITSTAHSYHPDVSFDRDVAHLLQEGETVVTVPSPSPSICNFEEIAYAREDIVEPDIAPQARHERYRKISQRSNSGSSVGSSPSHGDFQDVTSTPPPSPIKRHVTFDDLAELSKRFALDLAPKLFWTTDTFVNLLVSSNIGRYASFVLVQAVSALVENKIVEVPFSRAGIYNYPEIDASHKRKLMKFMQLCMDPKGHEKELTEMEQFSIGQYLTSMKIPAATREALIIAIALCSSKTPALTACGHIQKFLAACGKYGAESSPFLFPIYGCGEYPQYFARISAVFGGIQCLKRGVDAIITHKDGLEVKAIVSDGYRIDCRHLVLPVEFIPSSWQTSKLPTETVSRAILITTKSLFSRQKSQSSFLRIPKENDETGLIVVEASSAADICPPEYYVVYMWMRSVATARRDLEHHVLHLFEPARADYSRMDRPKVLWVCYYNHKYIAVDALNKERNDSFGIPRNVQFASGPSGSLDYEDSLKQATNIFSTFYPDLPFLPRVPDPEDVVIDGVDSPTTPDALDVVDKG